MLRPRYRPGWKPSWKGTKKSWRECEDGQVPRRADVLDATRIHDDEMVMLKRVSKSLHPYEVEIAEFFSTAPRASDPLNHCVPIHEILQDPMDPDIQILVMPFLRSHYNPPFETVGEIVEFFRQVFEGLQFMHAHRVAHRDCMVMNIMMDPKPLFPELYHPINDEQNRELSGEPKRRSRTAAPTKYYLIDFGHSRKYAAEDLSPRELPLIGGDKTVPEFQGDKYNEASDPFPTDVYYIGNLIREEYLQIYLGLDFMDALVADMTQVDPAGRPTMLEVVTRFEQICHSLSSRSLRRRLVNRDEGAISRLFRDLRHAIVSAGYIMRRLSPMPRPNYAL